MTLYFRDIDDDYHKLKIPKNKEIYICRDLIIFDKSLIQIELSKKHDN